MLESSVEGPSSWHGCLMMRRSLEVMDGKATDWARARAGLSSCKKASSSMIQARCLLLGTRTVFVGQIG